MTKRIMILGSILMAFIACDSPKQEKGNTSDETKQTDTQQEFNDIADEEGFAEQHDIPLTIHLSAKGELERIDVQGGDAANFYKREKKGSNNYLFVIHEWWGLNDHIINVADKLYDKMGNANVIALDLYDGKVATTREKAKEYMQGAQEDRIKNVITTILKTLPKDANVGTVGWCFGGGWSLQTAILAGDMTKACVIFYGMPTDDIEQLKALNSDVLFIYGNRDRWITPEIAHQFERNMRHLDKKVTVRGFEADHAFANPSSEKYDKGAAREANKMALNYLKQRMK